MTRQTNVINTQVNIILGFAFDDMLNIGYYTIEENSFRKGRLLFATLHFNKFNLIILF